MTLRARDAAPLSVLSLAFLALTTFFIIYRREMLDEGWYLLAGRLAWRGEVPIRDFAYFQSPLLPYVYGLSQKLAPGILSGRLLAAAATLGTWFVTLRITRRVSGDAAVPWAAAALLASVYFVSHYPLALTYAPGALLLALALDAATLDRRFRAVLFAGLAAGVRLSLAPAWLVITVAVLRPARTRADVLRVLAAVFLLAVVAVFFALPDPDVARFCLVGYHVQGATAAERWHATAKSLFDTLRSGGALFLPAALAPFFVPSLRARGLLGAVLASVFLANLVPATTAAYYQSVLAPLAAILAAPLLLRLPRAAAVAVLAVHLVAQGATAAQQHVVMRSTHGPVPFEARLAPLGAIGRDVSSRLQPSEPLWTLDPYFAVAANRDVVPGLEMGIFAVQADWPAERCRRYHVVSAAMLREQLMSGEARVVVLSTLDAAQLGGRDGPVLSALPGRYDVRARFERVGQFDGPVFVFVRRD